MSVGIQKSQCLQENSQSHFNQWDYLWCLMKSHFLFSSNEIDIFFPRLQSIYFRQFFFIVRSFDCEWKKKKKFVNCRVSLLNWKMIFRTNYIFHKFCEAIRKQYDWLLCRCHDTWERYIDGNGEWKGFRAFIVVHFSLEWKNFVCWMLDRLPTKNA